MIFESRADISKIRYFGNNRSKNLKYAPPKIKSDNDIVFVSGIPKDKALWLLKKACHDVSNFHPEYMEKAAKWSDD